MKILQVVHGLPPDNLGGTEVYAHDLAKVLTFNNEVCIFYRANDLRRPEYELTTNVRDSVVAFAINNTFRSYGSFEDTYKNQAVAEKFGALLDRIRPDIVHIQHLLYLSTEIINQAKKRKIPVVFTLHDYWLLCPQGQLFRNNGIACAGDDISRCPGCVPYQLCIGRGVLNCYYFLELHMPGILVEKAKDIYLSFNAGCFLSNGRGDAQIEKRAAYLRDMFGRVDLFISPTHFLRNKFIEFGLPIEKITTIPQGIDLDRLSGAIKTRSSKLRFGFVGNLLPAKGAHLLIESFNRIRDDNAELNIFGEVFSYKARIGSYLRRLKKGAKNRNIRFRGRFQREDLSKVFSEIDILVVPSLWYENSPLVIQEAFTARTPVIASRLGGIPELVQEGKNGFLFSAGSSKELSRLMKSLVSDRSLLNKLNIEPPGSIKEHAREIEKIYKMIIS